MRPGIAAPPFGFLLFQPTHVVMQRRMPNTFKEPAKRAPFQASAGR
jgi:hypothetical protein